MTGSELLSYVKQTFKRTDKDSEIYTAMADTVMDIRSRFLSDEHMSVSSALSGISASGDYTLTLPSDFGHLIGDPLVRDTDADTNFLPLKKISKEEYDELYSANLNTAVGNRITGVPVHYAYFGQTIYIGPAVDGTNYQFKINYTTEDTPTITSSTDPVPFTDQFREVVKDGVLMRMFNEMENYAESERFEIKYERGINKIAENDDFNSEVNTQLNYNGV